MFVTNSKKIFHFWIGGSEIFGPNLQCGGCGDGSYSTVSYIIILWNQSWKVFSSNLQPQPEKQFEWFNAFFKTTVSCLYVSSDQIMSLVIYNTSLVDLGLSSLREIKNGILVIEKNPNLTRLGFVSFEFAHGMTTKATAIYIKSNPRLCYVDKFNFTGLFDPSKKTVVGENAPASECGNK